MLCEVIEHQILDYLENQWGQAQREEVEKHLGVCGGCRSLARQLQQLDTALGAAVQAPALSSDFDRRLLERIHCAPGSLSEAQRAERKRRLQAEFEEGMVLIVRRSFRWPRLLNHLAGPMLAVLAGWAAWYFTPQLTARFHPSFLGGAAPPLLPWLAAGAVFLAVGLAEFFPKQWKFLRL